MTEARDPKRSRLGMLLARVGNPLNWSLADKCLVAGLLLLPFVASYAAVFYLALRRPDLAPYLDQAVLYRTFCLQPALLGGWLVMLVGALAVRRRALASRFLVHLTVQFYSLTALVGSYVLGHYTSLYTGVAAVGGYTVAFILFGHARTVRRPGAARRE